MKGPKEITVHLKMYSSFKSSFEKALKTSSVIEFETRIKISTMTKADFF